MINEDERWIGRSMKLKKYSSFLFEICFLMSLKEKVLIYNLSDFDEFLTDVSSLYARVMGGVNGYIQQWIHEQNELC